MSRSIQLVLFSLFAALVLAAPRPVAADVRLPAVFGDHMVIQRGMPTRIWGWAEPGESVSIRLDFEKNTIVSTSKGGFSTTISNVGKNGTWSVSLGTEKVPVGAKCKLTVKGKANTITFSDILIGEVWVCSGQSNMQWSVNASNNPKEEIAAANYPNIRLFYVPRVPSGTPKDNVTAKWEVCSAKTVNSSCPALTENRR